MKSSDDDEPTPPPTLDPGSDGMLSESQFLTAEEVIRRRHRQLIHLSRVYKDYYWALIAELRRKYRDYLWNFRSPFAEDDDDDDDESGFIRCGQTNCSRKAMPMTKFCLAHILNDPNQSLYKGCAYITLTSRSGSKVQTVCGKPILRTTTPSFCNYHLQRARKAVSTSLKKAGLSTNDSNKMASVIHIMGAEFVHEILRMRRASKESTSKAANKTEVDAK